MTYLLTTNYLRTSRQKIAQMLLIRADLPPFTSSFIRPGLSPHPSETLRAKNLQFCQFHTSKADSSWKNSQHSYRMLIEDIEDTEVNEGKKSFITFAYFTSTSRTKEQTATTNETHKTNTFLFLQQKRRRHKLQRQDA